MSMRNFPKIPKFIVRKSADQAKDTKSPNYESTILIFRKYVYFYVALPSRFSCVGGAAGKIYGLSFTFLQFSTYFQSNSEGFDNISSEFGPSSGQKFRSETEILTPHPLKSPKHPTPPCRGDVG